MAGFLVHQGGVLVFACTALAKGRRHRYSRQGPQTDIRRRALTLNAAVFRGGGGPQANGLSHDSASV